MNIHVYLIPLYIFLVLLVIVFVHWLILKKPFFPPLYVNTLPDVQPERIKKLTRLGNTFFEFMNRQDLPYVVICGSLLGIIRHSGNIIPWDDDIDVAIPEKDTTRIVTALKNRFGSQITEHAPGLYKFVVDKTLWVDIFVMKSFQDKFLYSNDKFNRFWPNEWLNANVFLKNGQISKLFCDARVSIPKEFKEYLDRSYPGWSEEACIGSLHNDGFKEHCLNIISSGVFNICKKL
jgi:phosphorylcholine metabolism protein LicD